MDFEKWDSDNYKEFIDIIRMIVRQEIALNRDDRHRTAVVKSINADKTINVALPEDPDNVVSGIKNPWNLDLSVDSFVQVLCKGGNLNNSWISTTNTQNKFKTT